MTFERYIRVGKGKKWTNSRARYDRSRENSYLETTLRHKKSRKYTRLLETSPDSKPLFTLSFPPVSGKTILRLDNPCREDLMC